ncbi:hypothetical protein KO465_00695 [Candidatus Micrarchaeota archaeon]|nr:hypothetical protein [Candidatus Micrarchaeota archaeon]
MTPRTKVHVYLSPDSSSSHTQKENSGIDQNEFSSKHDLELPVEKLVALVNMGKEARSILLHSPPTTEEIMNDAANFPSNGSKRCKKFSLEELEATCGGEDCQKIVEEQSWQDGIRAIEKGCYEGKC